MGAFEDYIDKIGSESGSMGPWLAHWRLCTLQSDYYHKYGRYPSKNELFECSSIMFMVLFPRYIGS